MDTRRAIVGGDTTLVTGVQAMPARAVVQITMPGVGLCSGTMIMRNVALMARHCICGFDINKSVTVDFPELVVNSVSGTVVASRGDPHHCPGNIVDEANAAADLAIVILSRSLTTTELPEVAAVYTNGNLYDLACNSLTDFPIVSSLFPCFSKNRAFFGEPLEIVGYGTGKKHATVPQDVSFTTASSIPFWSADGYWIRAGGDSPNSRVEPGDSGGPITFRLNGRPTVFGVSSNLLVAPIIENFSAWSPTWNNGLDNGDFIAQFLEDADGDSVLDSQDNCPPSFCSSGQFATCSNPNQEDSDGDGRGNACDNCPFRAGGSQSDLDGDGVGDLCDVCPMTAGIGGLDTDGDGVGDGCDTCPKLFNPPRACLTNTDCLGSVGPTCVLEGGKFGKCPDGSVCTTTCSTGTCTGIGTFSACAEGGTDQDGDGLGDSCDSCRFVRNSQVQANSNPIAESREMPPAPALGDACDQAPLFTAVPVVGHVPADSGGAALYDPYQVTLFTAYAGIGSATSDTPHPPFVGAPIGFRHCSCRDFVNNADVSFDDCAQMGSGFCPPVRTDFTNTASNWSTITVGAGSPGVAVPSTLPGGAPGFGLNPTYTSGVDCSDVLPHPASPGMDDQCRIGTPRPLFWFQGQDTGSVPPRVPSYIKPPPSGIGNPIVATTGVFWSHGDLTNPPTFGDAARDQGFGGRLRDHYTYVTTPTVSEGLGPRIGSLISINNAGACIQCAITVRGDLFRKVTPTPVFRNAISAIEAVRRPAILDLSSGTFRAIQSASVPAYDVTSLLSPGVQAVVTDPSSFFWVAPVEPGYRIGSLADTVAVVVPRIWSQGTSSIVRVLGGPGGLSLDSETSELASPPGPTSAANGAVFVPADRDQARWLFSAREQSVYMVGGQVSGFSTGEIWRYDLAEGRWRHLFGPGARKHVKVGGVLALAYDEARGKMMVLDRLTPNEPGPAPISRIIAFDTHKLTSRVVALVDVGAFTKVGLAARDDGTFVLVGTRAGTAGWSGYQFKLTALDDISWQGKKSGSGVPIVDPSFSDVGVSLFLVTGQTPNVVDLPSGAFSGSGPPADLQVCDHPPTITTPPPATISTCGEASIGFATVSNACGGSARVTSDRPVVFPLGPTTITWTATDLMGHTVSATQAVTVVLGDDPSCCPPGTNVIVGTSGNDILNGTAGADCILGLGAQDTINGLSGNDYISGGEGDDIIDGGAGNDQILGGGGQDQIKGGIGNDVIEGGDGDDQCWGGDNDDVIRGGQGQDKLYGENGSDQLFGNDGDDRLEGGPGNDQLNGGGLHDICLGGPGTDTFNLCQTAQQ